MAIIAPANVHRSTGSEPAIRISPITICSKVTFLYRRDQVERSAMVEW